MDTSSLTTNGEADSPEGEADKLAQANQLFGEVRIMLAEALRSLSTRSGDANLDVKGTHPSIVLSTTGHDR